MRIVYLLESAAGLWGGVKVALYGANAMVERGHEVTVLSRTEPPQWMEIGFEYRQVPGFAAENIPEADLIIGTDWSTVPFAVECGKGIPVHYVQGYEGCMDRNRQYWDAIDAVFRLPTPHKITISRHLQRILRNEFGCKSTLLPNMIDDAVMYAPQVARPVGRPVRVGLVGPYQIDWKDIQTGLDACAMAAKSGLDLELVRITNTSPAPAEQELPFAVEWHVAVAPHEMGDLYRSMDVFIGTSQGQEEGFYLPAVEAMACGVPCVLTDIACLRDYGAEHGATQYALFVPPKNPVEMAQAIVVLAGHAAVRDSLRDAGLRTAAQHTVARHNDALEAALSDILEAARPHKSIPAARIEDPVERVEPAGQAQVAELARLSSGIAQALSAACDAFIAVEDYAAAVTHMQAAVDIRPEDPDLLQQLGYVRYLSGDVEVALAIYEDLISRGVRNWAVLANKAMVHVSCAEHGKAIVAFEEAIELGGESAEIVNNLGVAWHRAGDSKRACQCFERALQIDAEYREASANLRDVESTPRVE